MLERNIENSDSFEDLLQHIQLPSDDDALLAEVYGALAWTPGNLSAALKDWFLNHLDQEDLSEQEKMELNDLFRDIEDSFDLHEGQTQIREGVQLIDNSLVDNPAKQSSLAEQVRSAVKLMKLKFLELYRSRESRFDSLTGLGNRRYFAEAFKRAKASYERTGQDHAVLLFDIDRFKHVNDTYGHDAGDAALKHFVKVLQMESRANELLARWGGEEFVALIDVTNPDEAFAAGERFRKALEASKFIYHGQHIPLTVSVGVSMMDGLDLDATVDLADKGLYEAKTGGRNQVRLVA